MQLMLFTNESSIKMLSVKSQSKKNLTKQRGLSLIELMIALGLGVFIIAGIYQVTVSSKQAFEVIQGQSMTQETGRFASQFVLHSGRQAGYINLGALNAATASDYVQGLVDSLEFQENIAARWEATDDFEAGSIIGGGGDASLTNYPDAKDGSDYLILRTQGDANFDDALSFSMRDCQGSMLDADPEVKTTVHYYVKTNNTLACRVDQHGAVNTTGRVVELVSGVEEIQIIYSVKRVDNQLDFLTAENMTAADWPAVAAFRMALLSSSDNQPLVRNITKEHQLLDVERDDLGDGRVRQAFYQTIALRNRL